MLYIGFERAGKCLICALLPQKLPLVCLTVCLILDARRGGLRAKKKPVRCVAGRAFVLSGGLIVWGCGCCTASSMGGWVSDLGRMGMCCVCPGMPLGVLLPVLLRCVVLLICA